MWRRLSWRNGHQIARLLREEKFWIIRNDGIAALGLGLGLGSAVPIKRRSRNHTTIANKEQHIETVHQKYDIEKQTPFKLSVSRRARDGSTVRRELKQSIQDLLRLAHGDSDRNSNANSNQKVNHRYNQNTLSRNMARLVAVALQNKKRLVELVSQPVHQRHVDDGALAQETLDALLMAHQGRLLQHEPALCAELTCLTIQAWCQDKNPEGIDRAERLFRTLLEQPHNYLSDKLELNTDAYNDCLSDILSTVTSQWPGSRQLPSSILRRMDSLIQTFESLVNDPTIRLDWKIFGVNQILYVGLKARRPSQAWEWWERFRAPPRTPAAGRLHPNLTTYNTILQTLALDGRVAQIESILMEMTRLYRQQRDSSTTRNTHSSIEHVQPNHFSVMPWITAAVRSPRLAHEAGIVAERAWRVVQEWHAQGLVDLSGLDQSLVWAAVARAWVVQAQFHSTSIEHIWFNSNRRDSNNNHSKVIEIANAGHQHQAARDRLFVLWQQAVEHSVASPNNEVVASPTLAIIIWDALDPIKEWDRLQTSFLDDMDTMIGKSSSLSLSWPTSMSHHHQHNHDMAQGHTVQRYGIATATATTTFQEWINVYENLWRIFHKAGHYDKADILFVRLARWDTSAAKALWMEAQGNSRAGRQ